MTVSASPKVVLGASSILIRDGVLHGADLRAFLDRAFSVEGVSAVEIDRQRGESRIRYGVSGDLTRFWKRLGQALKGGPLGQARAEALTDSLAQAVFLDAPGPVRVSRVGRVLSTFRIRQDAQDLIRISHPLLRRRRDLSFRLEEELAALPGVRWFRGNSLTAEFTVSLEPHRDAAERLMRELELAWPRLLDGTDGRASNGRLAVSGGLLALSAAGTFAAPALLPVAVAAIAIYGAPNLIGAIRDFRHGRIELPALYATGLIFFLATRVPLTSSILGVLTQLWPVLTRETVIASQRRLLAPYRRRPRWAWLVLPDGEAVETPADRLQPGDLIVVRRGETVPADGVIESGLVATADAAATTTEPVDKETGDPVRALEAVVDGEAHIRVTRSAADSTAAVIEAHLPHGPFARLPSLDEAQRVANRNVKPALGMAAYALATRRMLRPAQGVIRPDYITAPRLGAQLGAQEAFVRALRGGALFRNPAALDRLAGVDVFVFDETAPLLGKLPEVARVVTSGATDVEVLSYAAAAFDVREPGSGAAIHASAGSYATFIPAARGPVRRRAGSAWYFDAEGHRIDIASPAALLRAGITGVEAPKNTALRRSLWVLRDGRRLGRIDFRESAPQPLRLALDRLRALPGPVRRILYLSSGSKTAAARLGGALGADFALGGLSDMEKAHVIQGLGRKAAWIGDGSLARSSAAISASEVSFSTADPGGQDIADIFLPGGLEGLHAALTAARDNRRLLATDYQTVYAANLVAVAGALSAGFGGFQSGLVSNVATAITFARHKRRLDLLEHEQKARARRVFRDFSL